MRLAALHSLLWLLAAFAPAEQDMLTLHVTPSVVADRGEPLTLDCEVKSSQHGLSIKHMEWYRNNTKYCSVDSAENLTTHYRPGQDNFRCQYGEGRLLLLFSEVLPVDCGNFRCKLRSNKGSKDSSTSLELLESCGEIEGVIKDGYPSCTFTDVYPDGEVYWYHNARPLNQKAQLTKSVEEGGWLTIRSSLEQKSSAGLYYCSLRSTRSGTEIAGAQFEGVETVTGVPVRSRSGRWISGIYEEILGFHSLTYVPAEITPLNHMTECDQGE